MEFTEDFTSNELVFEDGTRIPFEPITDETPEWKAMLEWVEEYIRVLEWKAKS